MLNNKLKKISWKNGKYLDQYGNLIKKMTLIGNPTLITDNSFYDGKSTLKSCILLKLESLQNEHKKYAEVNAYLQGDWNNSTNGPTRYAVIFLKID